MQFGKLKLKHCRYGWMLFSGPFIGKCLDLYGQYSESEGSLMREFLHEGSTVIDVRESSAELLGYVSEKLGYKLYWHPAPIFDENDFFGNPVNHWAPQDVMSRMVLGVPAERRQDVADLRPVTGITDWLGA